MICTYVGTSTRSRVSEESLPVECEGTPGRSQGGVGGHLVAVVLRTEDLVGVGHRRLEEVHGVGLGQLLLPLLQGPEQVTVSILEKPQLVFVGLRYLIVIIHSIRAYFASQSSCARCHDLGKKYFELRS